jgi:hypothetical protein
VQHGLEQGTGEEIPRDRIQCGRDQFVGFEHAPPVFGLKPLGFLNIFDCKFAQTAELSIVGNWINCLMPAMSASSGWLNFLKC